MRAQIADVSQPPVAAAQLWIVRRIKHMTCPNCKKDSVPFIKLWLKSGYGTQRCSNCGATCRIQKSFRLRMAASFLGALSAFIGLHFHSWVVLGVVFVAALTLGAFLDFRFRRLELADAQK